MGCTRRGVGATLPPYGVYSKVLRRVMWLSMDGEPLPPDWSRIAPSLSAKPLSRGCFKPPNIFLLLHS